jgi:CubicO group peptidase (beta-lactamase class C family)
MIRFLILLLLFSLLACSKNDNYPETEAIMYFPPLDSDTWETTTPESLEWSDAAINELYDFLSENDTRAFILLINGKIVLENYWGNNILNTATFDKNSNWYWASAGKTLTAFLVGLAQEEDLLNINDKTSDYLGTGWTDLPLIKENLITIKHQLTMTTGLDYTVSDSDCTDPECLQYKTDAGTQWYYHNAPYTMLEAVISLAANTTYNTFTDEKIESKIGMNGTWLPSGDNNVFWSTPRDAARFGLLLLNEGKWDETSIMTNASYFNSMVNSSQTLNPSYGYLCWLNGKSSIVFPGLSSSFNIPLSTSAPADLFAAMGKNGQFIDVVPSENMVVIRMGEAPDNALVPVTFHDDMWAKISAIQNN